MRSRFGVGIAVMLAGLLCILGIALLLRDDQPPDPTPTGERGPTGLDSFYKQELSWQDCGASRCTWVRVPIDYELPTGETLRLRVKVRPGDSKQPAGRLFLNPGGPGGSGVEFVDPFVASSGQAMRRGFDIVGFDPRGVGRSTPLTCLSDKKFDEFTNLDPDPDNDAEIAALQKGTADLGKACEKNSGNLARHVSTLEAARDMDILRALLGETTLDYYGASYGTQLGATYAQLFPRRVGKMVLDGAIDPTLSDEQQGFGQAEGFQRALDSYIRDCVKTIACPLGTDPAAAEQKLGNFLRDLDNKPLKTDGKRQVTESTAFYGIAVTLYDRINWSALSAELTAAFRGDGTLMLYLADQYFSRNPDGSYANNGGQVIYAVRCLDSVGGSSVDEVKALEPTYVKASLVFGRQMAWSAIACTDWPFRTGNTQIKISAEGAAPIVVIGTTRDPATPYEWSTALAGQLDSGVLVTRVGDGHTGYHTGNPCIDSIVDRYLLEDVVPRDGVTCKAPTG